ncbi:MAG TPA: Si-specific NAD(P)(+) transhydrogenase [Steroidobacteraceae bacterium]|nr:Si-specific NAD(P)(+) transhydrogenase [Steroidobacteraceae bacterium]
MAPDRFDLICLGSGPAGQKAAIQASKAGFRAAVIEREPQVGGSCLLSGTIPSKALREQAVRYRRMRGSASSLAVELSGDAPLSALLDGVESVISAQDRYMQAQLARNQVALIRGRGSLLDANRIEVQRLDGNRTVLHAPRILLATGSRPRHVPAIQVDHEHILDSDSVLSLPYLPRTLIVLGSGVIACEYASIFAALGCSVTLLDKASEPLGFLDAPLRAGFLAGFQSMGGRYRAGAEVTGARFDGFSQVEVSLADGDTLTADIVFAAFGRIANLDGIGLDRVKLRVSSRGHVEVNERFETSIPGIYAAGDAIGPPALACAAADQGRRAALAAFGLEPPAATSLVPTGVYTIPEIACVGLSQAQASAKKIDVIVGRADFGEVARAHIAGEAAGFLSLLCERGSGRVLGVQVLGEGATDLVHLGQAAIATGETAEFFVEQIFNFPTMTEAYRVAAFDVMKQRSSGAAAPPALARAAG